jgi:hypothetical protein
VDEIVQEARERAERLLQSSSPVRALGESAFFEYLNETLLAYDDCPVLGAALDEIAVEYRCVCECCGCRLMKCAALHSHTMLMLSFSYNLSAFMYQRTLCMMNAQTGDWLITWLAVCCMRMAAAVNLSHSA